MSTISKFEIPKFHPEIPTAYEYKDDLGTTTEYTSSIVPNTFGEELSYYETLTAVVKKLNDIIDALNSGSTLTVETTTTSTEADHATLADTATSTNYANKASVAKCAERARVADYANEAGTAKKADRAITADNVSHSSTSDYATTAGSATSASNANYATTAGSATYAGEAGEADNAETADYATNAGKLQGHPANYFAIAGQVMTNPMTTAGDIIIATTDGVPQRLPVGTNGYVLKLVSGVPTWSAESGGGGTGEPTAYLKSALVSGNTLILTNKDDTTVTFSPVAVFG